MLAIDIDKRLGDFRLQAALEGPSQGVTVLFGASGAGKSALLSCVAGAHRPDAGRIALDGDILFDSASRVDTPMERRRIGWVFQDARLFPHLTVRQNLHYGERRARARGIAFDDVVAVLGIEPLLARRPRDLSGGERQRVGLGRALLSQPRLLLMDEPLAALDAPRKAEILPFLERLKQSFALPILYVTHSLAEAVRLGDHMVVMEQGRVLAQGPLAEVVGRPDLPLVSNRSEVGAVLEAVVAGHDEARGLTALSAGAWQVLVSRLDADPGAPARVFVLARDVMLAREHPQRISARNVLAGVVADLSLQPSGTVLVSVRAEGAGLLASLTADSVSELDLQPGAPVWAVVKSVAIEGAGGGLLALEG
jgi:molybdate transport system ATP-binding protein